MVGESRRQVLAIWNAGRLARRQVCNVDGSVDARNLQGRHDDANRDLYPCPEWERLVLSIRSTETIRYGTVLIDLTEHGWPAGMARSTTRGGSKFPRAFIIQA